MDILSKIKEAMLDHNDTFMGLPTVIEINSKIKDDIINDPNLYLPSLTTLFGMKVRFVEREHVVFSLIGNARKTK